MVSAKVLKNWL